jgi:hypothetical protein
MDRVRGKDNKLFTASQARTAKCELLQAAEDQLCAMGYRSLWASPLCTDARADREEGEGRGPTD